MGADDAADIARILQRGLLPTAIPEIAGLLIAARYHTGGSGEVGGDWFDVLALPHGHVACVIGDVAGHGTGAAATMAQLRYAVRAYLLTEQRPGPVLEKLNRLAEWALPGEVATTMIAMFDAAGEEVRIAAAGHLPPLLTAPGRTEYVAIDAGPALGLNPDAEFTEAVTTVQEGQILVLFTDGLVERRGEPIDDGLARLARACDEEHDGELIDHLVATVPPPEGDDDLAVLTICRDGGV